LKDFNQDEAGNEAADVGKKGNVCIRGSHTEELDEEPEPQDDYGRDANQLHKDYDEKQGKNPGARE
jgi:hypothetical protein